VDLFKACSYTEKRSKSLLIPRLDSMEERKERKKSLNELKNRKEKGEKDIIIRRGQIGKRTPKNQD